MSSQSRRLLIPIVDSIARDEPSRPFVFAPKASDPKDGWHPITFQQAANGINYVAHKLAANVQRPDPNSWPTIAYVGANDIAYILFMLGAVKAGCKSLMISPRNTDDVQLHLFAETECNHVCYHGDYADMVRPWLNRRQMVSLRIPDLEAILQPHFGQFPYHKAFEQAAWEPLVVVHTSGSTGTPKPVVSRQGLWTVGDEFQDWPEFQGTRVAYTVWAERATKIFLGFPFFHAGGLNLFTTMTLIMNTPCVLPIPTRPMSAQLVRDSIVHSGADAAALPSSILEDLSRWDEGVEVLQRLGWISFGGGNMSTDAGNRLAEQDVMLSNSMGSTDSVIYGLYPFYFIPDPKLWQYLLFNSERMGCEFRRFEGTDDDVFELVAVRGEPMAGVFYTFPELTEWSTRDLYKPHPTLSGYWAHYGRVDNVIVFSNGEKLNPVTIEDMLSSHPQLKGALVVGAKRFQAAVVLEPLVPLASPEDEERLISDVWPLVRQANEVTVAHGRIARELVMLAQPDKPFLRAGKGTIQRALATRLYEREIECLYERAKTVQLAAAPPLATESDQALAVSIQALFARLGTSLAHPDVDFFSAGIDSLQVTNATRNLRAGLAAAGMSADVSTATIYAHPTPRNLARYLLSTKNHKSAADDEEIKLVQALLDEHTRDLPTKREGRPDPVFESQTVVLTGSTGSLGSYLLDALIDCPNVGKIYALNRVDDPSGQRQTSISAERGLSTSFGKVRFLHAHLDLPQLGLGPEVYERLVGEADRIVHNAWPVNFHYSAASFASHVAGVRRLLNFAAAAHKKVPLVFVSSRGAVEGWSERGVPVPETQLSDLSLAVLGYGRAKAVSSLVLDAGCEISGVPCVSIRLGQIAGPKATAGQWNRIEFLSSLIRSSVHLGILPDSLGSMTVVDWVPSEEMARLVLDVAGVTEPMLVDDIRGYFHGVNPNTTTWDALVPAIMEFYAGRIKKTVGLEEWIGEVEKGATVSNDADKNPAVKLLDTYKGFLEAEKSGRGPVILSTKQTRERSPTMRSMEAITPELMKHWCRQWDF